MLLNACNIMYHYDTSDLFNTNDIQLKALTVDIITTQIQNLFEYFIRFLRKSETLHIYAASLPSVVAVVMDVFWETSNHFPHKSYFTVT